MRRRFSQPAYAGQLGQPETLVSVSKSGQHSERAVKDSAPRRGHCWPQPEIWLGGQIRSGDGRR